VERDTRKSGARPSLWTLGPAHYIRENHDNLTNQEQRMSATTRIASAVFSRVFTVPKEMMQKAGPQLNAVVMSVLNIGKGKVKEFIAALPILILFVRELLRQRKQAQAQKQLYIVGTAAALSALGSVVIGVLLSSLPVQLLLLITHPFLGLSLLVAQTFVIAAVITALAWLIIYVLNYIMADDPVYQKIRDEFLPPNTRSILTEMQTEIENGKADLDILKDVVEKYMKENGSEADAEKLEGILKRLEQRTKGKVHTLLDKMT